jgi:hypothetical protein
VPLPNLLIIGAAKCGTTSLHHYLDQHPDISMASRAEGSKEMRFFDDPDWREKLDWYEAHFADAPVRGESTPRYTYYPHVLDVPERIHSLIPDAKLVYLVRDPIDRIVSHWVQRYWGGDRTPFEQWLREADRPDNMIVCASRYATQVERYLALFAREQLLVLDQEDLRSARRETLREVFAFAGVDAGFDSEAFDEQRNTRAEKYAPVGAGARLWDGVVGPTGVLGRAGRRLPAGVRGPAADVLRKALFRKVEPPPDIDPALLDRLRPALREEADRLRAITGRDFAHWSV